MFAGSSPKHIFRSLAWPARESSMEYAPRHEHGDEAAALISEVNDSSSHVADSAEVVDNARLEVAQVVESAEVVDNARLDHANLSAIKRRVCIGDFAYVQSGDATTPGNASELLTLEKMQLENTLLPPFMDVKYSTHIASFPVSSAECLHLARARWEEQNYNDLARRFLYDRARTDGDYGHCFASEAFLPLVKMADARAFESMQLLHIAANVRAHHIPDIDAALRSRWRALKIYVALRGQGEEEMFASFCTKNVTRSLTKKDAFLQ